MPRRTPILLPSLASLAFVSLGLPDGLLGTAWPSMRASFGLSLDAQGALLLAGTVGYVGASFGASHLLARLTLGRLLAASAFATALALLGYAASPLWWALVALAFVLGAGGGAIDAGLNTWASTLHGPRMLNWLHACWGAGAAMGPAIVVLVLEAGRSWRLAYALVGAAQLALAVGLLLTSHSWTPSTAPTAAGLVKDAAMRQTLRLSSARLGALVYFVHVGVEVGFGVWAFTLLTEGRGIAPAVAGFWLSVYWGGLTVGRLLASFAAARISPAALVRGCLVAISVGAALVWADGTDIVAFAGLALAGLACGPVFPTLMATTPGRVGVPHVAHTVGLQVAAGALGAALLPALMGVVAQRLGLETLGPQLLGLSVGTLLAHEVLLRHQAT
jgi:fucose permease